MIYIYTENLCVVPRIKSGIKWLLGRGNRGPQAVANSFLRGLRELDVPVVINIKPNELIDTACVLSGACALRKAIEWKKKGLVKNIVAGPNIVAFPDEAAGIVCDPSVDIILVPAQWVKDLWVSLRPELEPRINVWASGVQDSGTLPVTESKKFLIYKKHVPAELFDTVIRILNNKGFSYVALEYGSFKQQDYFSLLGQVEGMLYLTESESQGLALAEAWIRNVPTLVWDRGLFQGGGHEWRGASSAPYLTNACGMRFKGEEDFEVQLERFLATIKTFHPQEYAREHFTDKKSAEHYLSIIKQ